ncbi:MAG: biotin/lipoyl-binding protein [Anaerolineae bacterium]|jgi:biotin carboxyl carrier protein
MSKEFTITLDGVEYPVVADGEKITVNGRPFTVEVTDEAAILVDGIAYNAALEGETAVLEGDTYPYKVQGLSLSAAAPPPVVGEATAVEAGAGAVLAIMPGKIVRILVEPGQTVDEGEPVCVLEAMKMENELQARQSGTVQAVHVKVGEDVEKDQVLIEIE